ncbi:DUF1259 domain-containing protein [Autumnicola edwardsiae]|uniref:DUF1259 domain-containing protein n=1 Tax=Autumnicola edwardsiae TaxID=3075594 RepID=A0ABU3CXE9_9FLAO|nr:DUF1259 domain-containing protein [Zunongwangia sp. F297]MDT0651029.1 DUF1259 domain-containing protein [Zunongwangia sp. F297]
MKKLWIYLVAISVISFGCEQSAKKEGLKESTEKPSKINKELKAIDIETLKSVLGMEGKEQDGQFKITVPQNDLNVMVDGIKIIPPMGLGSWVAFAPTSDQPMIMGDIVVTEKDLKPVQQEVINQGLTITGIHNHFARMEPDIWYMHIGGMGDEKKLAGSVKAVFDKITEIRSADPSSAAVSTVQNTLDTRMIDSILGYSGTMNNGVYKTTIGRPDVNLKEHGAPVSTFMGFNIWASWQGTNEKAAVAGDFAMLENEVEPVTDVLIENGIEVVALHNHMVHENPRIFFLHYWGVGPAEKLARGLREALDKTGVEN